MTTKRSRPSQEPTGSPDEVRKNKPIVLCSHIEVDSDLKKVIWRSYVTSADLELPCLALKHEELFCLKCDDFVFHPETDAILSHASFERSRRNGMLSAPFKVPFGTGLCGLVNLGNTCFMSSILQVVLRLESLRNYFLAGSHRAGCMSASKAIGSVGNIRGSSNASRYRDLWSRSWMVSGSNERLDGSDLQSPGDVPACFGCELEILMSEMFCPEENNAHTHAPLIPYRLLQNLWLSSPALAGYYQQDAQELYNALVNAVHSHVCSTASLTSRSPSPEPSFMRGSSMNGSNGIFEPSSPSGASQRDGSLSCQCIIHSELGGVLRSCLVCETCGNESSRYEPFFEVPLDLLGVESDSLEERLNAFVKSESLQGVMCSKCATNQDATKRMSLHVIPPTLALHLKRFQASTPSDRNERTARISSTLNSSLHKNDVSLKFPLCGLNLSAYTSTPQSCICDSDSCECYMYDLRAVVQHTGQLAGGHYIAYAKIDGTWFCFNDEIVSRVSDEDVQNAEAYMLFYSRRIVTSKRQEL